MDAWLSVDSNCYFGCLWLLSGLMLWNLTLQFQMYFAFPWVKSEFNLQRRKKKKKQKQDNYLGNWKCQMPRELLDAMFLFPILLHANNSFPYNFRQKVFGALILTSWFECVLDSVQVATVTKSAETECCASTWIFKFFQEDTAKIITIANYKSGSQNSRFLLLFLHPADVLI